MPAINFMKKFADAVQNGDKCQTIRKARKNPIKPGDTLYLYTGQRTSNARKLKETKCTDVKDIEVHDHYVMIESQTLAPVDANAFAVKDGFKDRHEMIAFFEHQYRLPFYGKLIEWA